ncbi:MAG: FAD-binding oxidoreductase [Asgard group archaeon]|nr:FAD-binding oxidoreductase [Asgard group archaeon]
MKFGKITPEIIQELKDAVGKDIIFDEEVHRMAYSRDWSPRDDTNTQLPDVVVRPRTTEQAAKIVEIANKYRIPVIAMGGLTGMGGGAVAIYGGIAFETKGMNKVIEIDEDNMMVTTQAGITLWDLNQALKNHGLYLPHEPESKKATTVGSSIACNNDSTFGIRHGRMVDHLSNAVIITGEGKIVRVGRRKALCSDSGYQLNWLLVGSEGTLGIVVEATLKVIPIQKTRMVDMVVFPSLDSSMHAIRDIIHAGLALESAHINCKQRLKFYTHSYREKHGHEPDVPDWAEALLGISFASAEETDKVVKFSRDYALEICERHGGQLVKEVEITDGWWASKYTVNFTPFKQKWPDSQREKKFGASDGSIPIGKIEEAYEKFLEIAKKYNQDILGMCVYHERPNRLSPSISFAVFVDDKDPENVKGFYSYVREMSEVAVMLEGSSASYIGDSEFKTPWIGELEHQESYDYMFGIKKVFDPNGILNPGKKFPVNMFGYEE